MSLLPGQIIPQSVSFGTVNEDGTVTIDKNWWLLLYNLCNQSLGTQGGLPASALESIEITDLDIATADVPTIVRQVANLNVLLPDQEIVPALRDITNALLIAISQAEDAQSISGLASPTAKVGLTVVNGSESTAMRSDAAPPLDQGIAPTWTGNHTFSNPITVNGAGSSLKAPVTVAAPASNVTPATVNNARANAANAIGLTLTDPVTGAQTVGFGTRIQWSSNSAGTLAAIGLEVGGTGTNNESQISLYTQQSAAGGLTQRVLVGSNGNVTINAPSSGQALAMTGTAAGTAAVTVNTSATTGAQTASFSATNKPGAASGSPQKWLPIIADGTTYYVPLFS